MCLIAHLSSINILLDNWDVYVCWGAWTTIGTCFQIWITNGHGDGGDLDGQFPIEKYCYKIELFICAWSVQKPLELAIEFELENGDGDGGDGDDENKMVRQNVCPYVCRATAHQP